MFCLLVYSYNMDKNKAGFAHRQSRSKERRRRESTSTTRATKRDRPRADRPPLSSRIDQFARQLEHRHSASSTARDKNPRGVTTEPAMQSVASNPDVARPSAPPQSRECREQPTSTTALPCVVVTARQASKRRSHTVCAQSQESVAASIWSTRFNVLTCLLVYNCHALRSVWSECQVVTYGPASTQSASSSPR